VGGTGLEAWARDHRGESHGRREIMTDKSTMRILQGRYFFGGSRPVKVVVAKCLVTPGYRECLPALCPDYFPSELLPDLTIPPWDGEETVVPIRETTYIGHSIPCASEMWEREEPRWAEWVFKEWKHALSATSACRARAEILGDALREEDEVDRAATSEFCPFISIDGGGAMRFYQAWPTPSEYEIQKSYTVPEFYKHADAKPLPGALSTWYQSRSDAEAAAAKAAPE